MNRSGEAFWEERWKQQDAEEYEKYLPAYYKKRDPTIDLLKQQGVHRVCDAACGFGAYSLMLASNGFEVEGFDISPTSVEITKHLLARYGVDTSPFKAASVLDTGYTEFCFDAVTAISVLDHMSVADARKALCELLRIVKKSGIIVVSFDALDDEDLAIPHTVAEDGSLLYTERKTQGHGVP